jgi:hypothetical protein
MSYIPLTSEGNTQLDTANPIKATIDSQQNPIIANLEA